MAAKKLIVQRVSQVRDIFLFSSFTGLAYTDLQKLKRPGISTGIDGGKAATLMRCADEVSAIAVK